MAERVAHAEKIEELAAKGEALGHALDEAAVERAARLGEHARIAVQPRHATGGADQGTRGLRHQPGPGGHVERDHAALEAGAAQSVAAVVRTGAEGYQAVQPAVVRRCRLEHGVEELALPGGVRIVAVQRGVRR